MLFIPGSIYLLVLAAVALQRSMAHEIFPVSAFVIFFTLFILGYFSLFAMRGRTPSMRVAGIRVVQH